MIDIHVGYILAFGALCLFLGLCLGYLIGDTFARTPPPWSPRWGEDDEPLPPATLPDDTPVPSIIVRAWEERGRHTLSGSPFSFIVLRSALRPRITEPDGPEEIEREIHNILNDPS